MSDPTRDIRAMTEAQSSTTLKQMMGKAGYRIRNEAAHNKFVCAVYLNGIRVKRFGYRNDAEEYARTALKASAEDFEGET